MKWDYIAYRKLLADMGKLKITKEEVNLCLTKTNRKIPIVPSTTVPTENITTTRQPLSCTISVKNWFVDNNDMKWDHIAYRKLLTDMGKLKITKEEVNLCLSKSNRKIPIVPSTTVPTENITTTKQPLSCTISVKNWFLENNDMIWDYIAYRKLLADMGKLKITKEEVNLCLTKTNRKIPIVPSTTVPTENIMTENIPTITSENIITEEPVSKPLIRNLSPTSSITQRPITRSVQNLPPTSSITQRPITRSVQKLPSENIITEESVSNLPPEIASLKQSASIPILPEGKLTLRNPETIADLRKSIDLHPSAYTRNEIKNFNKKLIQNLDPNFFKKIQDPLQLLSIFYDDQGEIDTSLSRYLTDDQLKIIVNQAELLNGNVSTNKQLGGQSNESLLDRILKAIGIPTTNKNKSKPIPTAVISQTSPQTEEIEVQNINTDINTDKDIINSINEKLDRFYQIEKLTSVSQKTDRRDKLNLDKEQYIGKKCLLYFFSDKKIFSDADCNCTSGVRMCYDSSKKIQLKDLIKLSNNFENDTDFYQNLSDFILGVTELITQRGTFVNVDEKVKNDVLLNFKNFILESLTYSVQYMKQYQVITSELITINNRLLFLYYKLVRKLVDHDNNITKLQEALEKLNQTINATINEYSKYQSKSIDTINSYASDSMQSNTDIQQLITKLNARVELLKKEAIRIKNNSKTLDNKTSVYEGVVEQDIRDIGNKL